MTRILVQNHGRMANQLVAWAKAMCLLKERHRKFVLKYPPLAGMVELANCEIVDHDTTDWIPVEVGTAPIENDIIWPAQALWDAQVDHEEFVRHLRSIRFTEEVTRPVDALMGNDHFVGLHVRYGDYVAVNWKKPPLPLPPFIRASNDYFLSALAIAGKARKVFLASDGSDAELKWLTDSVSCVRNVRDSNPALDLYALTKCDVIIGSASTFGHVAAMHGDKPFITPGMTLDMIKEKVAP